MRKKVNFLPNIITAFALCCGLYAIFKINMVPVGEVSREVLTVTAALLLLAAFADLLDGAVARVMKVESEFGGLFDSMADSINFGLAPSIIVLKTLSIHPGTEFSYLIMTAAMIYSVSGVLRLVRFNVNKNKIANDAQLMEAAKKHFTGLPIPAAAAAVISANLFLASEELKQALSIDPQTHFWILFIVLIIIGYFMVSRWKFPSFKSLHIRVTNFRQVFLIVVFSVFVIFYGFLQHFSVTFALFSWTYVVIGWVLSIVRKISGNKSKTLEDFEPEKDDLEDLDS